MLHSSTPYLTRRARLLLGMTQDQFGEMFDVDVNTVSRWETGKLHPHPAAWKRINQVASIRDVLARESPVPKFVVPMDDLLHPTLLSKGLEAALTRYGIDHKEIYQADNLLTLVRSSAQYRISGAHAIELIQADPEWSHAAYAEAHCMSILLGMSWSRVLIAPIADTNQAILEWVCDHDPKDPKDGFWVNIVPAGDLPWMVRGLIPQETEQEVPPKHELLSEMHRSHRYRGGRLPHLGKKY
jgi:transcriptional regulator with XRE-family HTH domain